MSGRIPTLAAGRYGVLVLVVSAVIEATIFPAPTEAALVVMTIARPGRAWILAGVATAASVAGGLVGYIIAASYFPTVVAPLLDAYGLLDHLGEVKRLYRNNYVLALITSGYTPVPYMLYTAIAGVSALPLPGFLAASLVGRALKYFAIAFLSRALGPSIHRFLERFGWIPMVATVAAGVVLYLTFR